MALLTFVLIVASLWSALHAINYYINIRYQSSILPTTYSSSRSWGVQLSRAKGSFAVKLHLLHLKLETTSLNRVHDKLSAYFSHQSYSVRRASSLFPALIRGLYDLGAVFGVLGLLCTIAMLFWTCSELVSIVLVHSGSHTQGLQLSKRSYTASPSVPHASPLTFQPVVRDMMLV
jgi:hypothetical protein